MDTERRRVTRPDGRHVDFLVAGPADGLPLVLHEGTPVGLVLYPPTVQAARIRGLRVILAARPGYEGSTPRPAGGWWTWPGTRRPSSMSSARTPSSRLAGPAAARTRWPAPRPCPGAAWRRRRSPGWRRTRRQGLDWLAGMGPENIEEFGAAVQGEAALTAFLDRAAAMVSTLTGESVAKSLGGLVIQADQAVLTGEFADHVAASLRASMNSGIAGWRDDDLAFVKDWGFSLGWDHRHRRPATRRRSPSGRATRTGWSRSRTASGWPRTSKAPAPT